jgi:hypothetical protein
MRSKAGFLWNAGYRSGLVEIAQTTTVCFKYEKMPFHCRVPSLQFISLFLEDLDFPRRYSTQSTTEWDRIALYSGIGCPPDMFPASGQSAGVSFTTYGYRMREFRHTAERRPCCMTFIYFESATLCSCSQFNYFISISRKEAKVS